ncbi:hypothetical protein DFH08DRAFT_966591 [Mycena albidolilacea]|uniref:NmrA-like domain-containing protein n=1 Tax=Mycena albidolilacea TaxID=1033008 RepID=A0AAD6ZNB0_9AGAR|nr:hypothetical protein DFH08DRAFT_966591 [Mycena albidolilacea]
MTRKPAHQPLLPGEQVYVDNVKIFRSMTADGTVQHEAELTELLPKGWTLSQPGVHKPEELMPVGSVAQHLDGSVLPSNLTFGRANRVLLADRGDEYGVILYFQPDDSDALEKRTLTSGLDHTLSQALSVLIIGASGTVGRPLVQEFLKHKTSFSRIVVLSDPAKLSRFTDLQSQGVEVVVGSFLESSSYKGFDTVISLAGNAAMKLQPGMIEAAIAGGARHFYPSELGTDISYGNIGKKRFIWKIPYVSRGLWETPETI